MSPVRRMFGAIMHGNSRHYKMLFGLVSLLVLLGLVMVLSSSSVDELRKNADAWGVFLRQGLFVIIGATLMLITSRLPVDWLFKHANRFYLFGGIAQLSVFSPLGVSVNGNRNWLDLGLFTIQPSEFWKLAMIIMVAKFVHQNVNQMHDQKEFTLRLVGFVGLPLALVGLFSSDMGTAIIFLIVILGMLFLSGVPREQLRLPLWGTFALLALGLAIGGSRMARVQAWLKPGTDDATQYDWQAEHGIWALAAGGLNGVGLGNSKLKWSWIPEVDNDYIFAIIGEEWGWIGASVIIILFILTINLLRLIALETKPAFNRMLVMGIMVWISGQALVNIAVVLRFLPVLGVPLPLISAGGSSLIATMIAIGVVLAVDRENNWIAPEPLQIKRKAKQR